MRGNFFAQTFSTPLGVRDIPAKFPGHPRFLFETQGRQTFEGGHELFRHHPFVWKNPTRPGGLRTQEVNLCALFLEWQKLERGYKKKRNDGLPKPERGYKKKGTVPETGTRVHLPKPPFSKTTLSCFLSNNIGADFGAGDATTHFSLNKKGFQWKGGRHSVNEGFSRFLQEKQFSEEVRAMQWTAGLWKLKSCCSHPLPKNQLLFANPNPTKQRYEKGQKCLIFLSFFLSLPWEWLWPHLQDFSSCFLPCMCRVHTKGVMQLHAS